MSPQAGQRQIALHAVLPTAPVWAPIDVYQMEQVLLNILKNAFGAIEEEGAVELHLTASPIRLIIRNNGTPIPKEKEASLFSPFFSTKKEGQGIGLTLTREILLNHHAQFSLRTGEDVWTYYQINLNHT